MSSVEIVSRIEPRRKWSAAEKAALLAEVDAEGGRVTLVARRHRISESLLYNWRAARKAAVAARKRDRASGVSATRRRRSRQHRSACRTGDLRHGHDRGRPAERRSLPCRCFSQ